MRSLHAWHLYWLVWFLVTFGVGFLIPEIYAMCTDWRRTLSATVWNMEDLVPGQSVWAWHASHLIFTGLFILIMGWLVGHFGWGLWR